MLVDGKLTSCHGFSFQNLVHSGVVHTSGVVLLLLLGWIGAKPREMARLITIEAGSPYCTSSSNRTGLSCTCNCLCQWYYHFVRLLRCLEILSLLLWWPNLAPGAGGR
jgi:hypothetical protein